MEDMLKIAAVAIISAICAVVVKKNVQELGMVLALLAGALILTFAFSTADGIRRVMDDLTELAGLSEGVLTPVIKTVGIAIITKISAEVCRDAKEGGLAAFVEIAGTATALFVALPLLEAVLDLISELM